MLKIALRLASSPDQFRSGPWRKRFDPECSRAKPSREPGASNSRRSTGPISIVPDWPDGVVCTYDSRHRILKVPMEDGSIFELLQERADSGTIRAEYRTELMTTRPTTHADTIPKA